MATPDPSQLHLPTNDMKVRAKLQLQQEMDYNQSKNRARTMLKRFDTERKANDTKINEFLNYNKIDIFRRLENSNGDRWFLPTDDPQYLNLY